MKKVLFASTALVAGALAAPQFASAQSVSAGNADITFGGYARFGLLYVDEDGGTDSTDLTHRFRLQIDATAESDAGVTFGARVRINRDAGNSNTSTATIDVSDAQDGSVEVEADAGNLGRGVNGVRFFARAAGLEVGVGNIFGALESMPGQYPIDLGLTGHDYDYTAYSGNADAYSSGGDGASNRNGVEVMYSAGDFAVHASASEGANDRVAAYASYSFSGITAALGFQDSDSTTDTDWTATIGGDIGPANVTLAYADNQDNGEQIVLAGRFDVSASTNVEAYVANRDGSIGSDVDGDSYGVDFNMDMGGGTSLRGGVSNNFADDTAIDFGVRFNF